MPPVADKTRGVHVHNNCSYLWYGYAKATLFLTATVATKNSCLYVCACLSPPHFADRRPKQALKDFSYLHCTLTFTYLNKTWSLCIWINNQGSTVHNVVWTFNREQYGQTFGKKGAMWTCLRSEVVACCTQSGQGYGVYCHRAIPNNYNLRPEVSNYCC